MAKGDELVELHVINIFNVIYAVLLSTQNTWHKYMKNTSTRITVQVLFKPFAICMVPRAYCIILCCELISPEEGDSSYQEEVEEEEGRSIGILKL